MVTLENDLDPIARTVVLYRLAKRGSRESEAKWAKPSGIIDRASGQPLRAEDRGEGLVTVGHFGMRGGGARVGSLAAHRPLTLLAVGEIRTFGFPSHCGLNAESVRGFRPI